ncbi:histidine kinase-, DNA gyrase B-, and HSP90-like ATPase family protein [Asticcacaulis biprosthecium C19]|uniref:Histidine kinase-, DNA gyrase B-, and HSP90-like ATPase family protein n=1 Tax=Asticcacaulis biprosthecium C19 TaxID=715226 RepID=F4QU80_9CAUL|nr:ATP-binding protein [Asticcacaulis biprosthecium]EGF89380.1 histidine kinase-, DNA gyrase B-, and HSP90-like ATPase family protein [Asticcacaulis biprosthecium C19]
MPIRILRRLTDASSWRVYLILAVAILAALVSFSLSLQHRYLDGVVRRGETLQYDAPGQKSQTVVSLRHPNDEKGLILLPSDLTVQVEAIGDYAALDAYRERQDRIVAIMKSPTVQIGVRGPSGEIAEVPVQVRELDLSRLGEGFWGPLIVGLTAFLIGGWVWCLKPHETVTQVLAINGLGMLIAAATGAICFSQPIAAPSALISAVLDGNHLGTAIFGMSLISLFLIFPKRLVSDRVLWAIMATSLVISGLDFLRLLGATDAIFVFCFAVMAAVTGLIGIQSFKARKDPNAKASLLWLGLAVFVGAGLWCLVIGAHVVQGQMQTMPGSYVFISFLITYAGIAIGVARFRLFEVRDWAFRIFFYAVAAVLFIALDAGLIYLLGLTQSIALPLALAFIGFAYLPLRDLLWRRFLHGTSLNDSEILAAAMDMAFAPQASLRQAKWQGLLNTLFTPQVMAPAPAQVDAAFIDADGLHLHVPGLTGVPALTLSFPQGGRGLFSPKHVELVNQILRLSREAMQGLTAYERGAAEQRHRLAQNLHDDVGAKLVSGLSVADDASRPFIYEALTEIRDIASAMITESAPLDRVVAEMRHETVRRLDAARIDLDWPLWPEDAPFVQISALDKKALTSAMRETITNCIKHAGAQKVAVRLVLTGNRLQVNITDDGKGFGEQVMDGSASGQGLRSIADRIAQTGGIARFSNAEGGQTGAVIAFDMPLTPSGSATQ